MKNFRVFMVGLLCLLVCTSLAQGQPLVWDVSVAGAPAYGDADALTGVFDQIGFYSQTSTIQFDTDGDGVPSPGDRLVDAGDLRVRSLLSSKIIDTEGLNQFGGYEVTARWTDVEGYITGTTLNPATGDTRVDIRYTSGTLNLYLDPALDSKFANPAGTATPAGAGGTGFENGTPIATLSVKDGIGHTFIDLNGGDIDNQGSAELYLQFTTALNGFWRDAAGGVIDPVGTIVTALVDMNIDSTTHVDGVPAGALYTAYSNQDGSILVDTAQCYGRIGDYVWLDKDRDGLQDEGEPGIYGVALNLFDAAGNLIASTTTDTAGYYQFEGLCFGDYTVEIDETTVPAGYFPTTSLVGDDRSVDSNVSPAYVSLSETTPSDQTIDFGYQSPCTGEIGDFVWNDINKNGIQDSLEPGIPDVTVWLKDLSGEIIAETQTNGDGFYLFSGLCAGSYVVEVDSASLPMGLLPTLDNQGGDDALDSDGSPVTVTLPQDDAVDRTIDFGYYQETACIGDFVWNDANADGIQDDNESGIPLVKVVLLDCAGTYVAETLTNEDGWYEFCNVEPGDYKVQFVLPGGYAFSPMNQGGDDGLDSDADPTTGTTACTTLEPGETDLTWDAGMYLPCDGEIGNYVWNDADRDGIQDADETGIAGVTVKLLMAGQVVDTTTTDGNGYYLFTNLCPGTYTVEVMTPAGYLPTPVCSNDATIDGDANCSPQTVVSNNDSNTTIDFGFYVMSASLGDYVWNDANNNGVQDAGEVGIAGVTVNLIDCATNTEVATTTTAADGMYLFQNLMPGSYRVEFVAPMGYAFTTPNVGSDATDSDANASGVTECITLAAGESNTTVDAGLYQPAPAIDIEKYTNGEDADTPTGPMVAVGSEITWTYVVTNHGNVTLTNVMVVDNQGVSVSCPSTTLLPSEVMTCTGYGTAVAGQYANLGTVTGDYNGMTVTDSDPSHYFAAYPSIDVEKYVSTNGTNWFDADQAPGIEVAVCPDLNCDAETEYECQQKKDYYWKEFERTKYEHDNKKNDYEKKKSDRDRSRSVHDKAKYNRDSSKKNCDVKQKEYESAKSKYESSKSYLDKRRMDKAKSEYDSAKSECDKKDSDYNWKKSDHDTKKSDCDRAKAEYDKAKADHSKAKNDWEKRKDRDCGVPTDPQCGTDTCQSSVYFKFVVTNTGTVPLGEMSLDDSIYETSSCMIPASLAPGAAYDCVIGPKDAIAGQHTNTATATGSYMGAQVSDSDDANYFGKVPCTPLGTGTPGYWMNHPEAWPVDSITIGGVVYSKDKAILLMKSPVKLDKTYTMFPALVSAKLNVLSCNESSCIAATIQAADDWMRVYGPVGSGVLASSSAWQIGEPLYLLLDEYNNGLLCAPSRDTLENDYADHKGCSTKTVSYWVDSTKYWPSKEVRIGGKTYDKATAISCMKGSKTKDGSYIMYRALASAKLNALEGNDVSCIADTLRAADEWMYKYGPCGKGVAPGSWAWKTGEPIWQKLDDYNNGKLDVVYKKDRKTTTYISYWTR